jgi:hypothetical protein
MADLGQFQGLRSAASNICDGSEAYPLEYFAEDFPQFFSDAGGNKEPLVPAGVLAQFALMAEKAVTPDRWFEKWRWACGLFVAHYSTVYLKSYQASSESAEEAAQTGQVLGMVSSASLGDASVSYDNRGAGGATERWGSWNDSVYGQQLIAEAKLCALGGTFAI